MIDAAAGKEIKAALLLIGKKTTVKRAESDLGKKNCKDRAQAEERKK